MRKANYLVTVKEENVRDAQIAVHPNADHGDDDGWIDVTYGELVLGTYEATSREEAIVKAALSNGMASSNLQAFELAPHSFIKEAVKVEVEFVILDEDNNYSPTEIALVRDNMDVIAGIIEKQLHSFSEGFAEDIIDPLNQWLSQHMRKMAEAETK